MNSAQTNTPNPIRFQPSWAQRNGPVYEEPAGEESPALTDSVGSAVTQHQLQPPPKKKHAPRTELSCCHKVCIGWFVNNNTFPEMENGKRMPAGSVVESNGIILMKGGTIAIFPEKMTSIEGLFYGTMGSFHLLSALIFFGMAVASLILGCHMKFTFAGIWCGIPLVVTAIFSFVTAKNQLRKHVKKLFICVFVSMFTSVVFSAIAYLSAQVDGIYYKWTDIKDDQMFKIRAMIDGICIGIGPIEGFICLAHLLMMASNIKDECTYRCCPRRRFRKFLREEGQRHEILSFNHLKKKKEQMTKLIADLEEEERYKEKWKKDLDAKKPKDDQAYSKL